MRQKAEGWRTKDNLKPHAKSRCTENHTPRIGFRSYICLYLSKFELRNALLQLLRQLGKRVARRRDFLGGRRLLLSDS